MIFSQYSIISLIATSLSFASAEHYLSSELDQHAESSHRQLPSNQFACGEDLEIYLLVDEECPSLDEEADVGEQSGNLVLSNWAEGTGDWEEFEDYHAVNEIHLLEKGMHKISVCFHRASYISFKSMVIGDEMGGPRRKKPSVILAPDYVSFVDNDMTSNGLPTLVPGDAVGYINSGESLDYEVDVRIPGSFPVSYQLSRKCDTPPEPEKPESCPNGGVKCGDNRNCCNSNERCYIHSYFQHGQLAPGNSHNLNIEGTCCPIALSCGDGCCPNGHTCDNGSCKSNDDNQSDLPTCKGNEYNCGTNTCCSRSEDCFVEGISGPINHRSLRFDTRKLPEGSCCPRNRSCNLECCSDDETCVQGSCQQRGCPAQRSCGDECCNPGEICVNGTCDDRDTNKTVSPTASPFSKHKERKMWSGTKYSV